MSRKMMLAVAACFVVAGVVGFLARQVLAGGRPPRGRGFPGFRRGGAESEMFQVSTLPKTEKEKRILEVLEDPQGGGRRFMANVPTQDGRLLRVLAEAINARHVVEIGTSNGVSALWMSAALVNTGGKLTTFEISQERAEMARENFKRAGVGDIVTVIEGDAHEKVKQVEGTIDMLFLDADKQGYIDYLEKLLPKVRSGGLVVAHNMNPRMADPDYLKAITENPELETIFVQEPGGGVGVTLKKR